MKGLLRVAVPPAAARSDAQPPPPLLRPLPLQAQPSRCHPFTSTPRSAATSGGPGRAGEPGGGGAGEGAGGGGRGGAEGAGARGLRAGLGPLKHVLEERGAAGGAGTRSSATRPWGAGTRECLCACTRVLCMHICLYICACVSVYMLVCMGLYATMEQECCPAARGYQEDGGASAEDTQEHRQALGTGRQRMHAWS